MTGRTSVFVTMVTLVVGLQFGAAGADDTTSTTAEPSTTTTVAPTTLPPTTATPLPALPMRPVPGTPQSPVSSTTSTSTTTTTTVPPPSVSDAAAKAYVNSLARSGASSTGRLLDALKALETIGYSHDEAIKIGFGHFPVGGPASFRDDFGDFRAGPPEHTHQGNDIFAAFNTPIRAPFDGVVRFGSDPLGGQAVYLTQPDGTFFYICHLNAYPPNVVSGSAVAQGTVIGLVGDTGDARGMSPHAHFEIHPGGGAAVNPKPILDGWLADALAAIPKLVGAAVVDQPAVIQSTGLTRRFDLTNQDQRVPGPVEPLLWASSVNPAGSALRLAQGEAAKLADGIDWEKLAPRFQAPPAEEAPASGERLTAPTLSSPRPPSGPPPPSGPLPPTPVGQGD
ncbi:MAG: M23 family metallopeptidase [Acidimicrobiales bacterium]